MTPPAVSVLVVNWNTCAATVRCIDALAAAAKGDDVHYEAIVVENGSSDGSRQALGSRDDIHLIANDTNRGFAAAVNQAHRAANGKFVLLLNSDVELTPGAMGELVRFLRTHPQVAGVAPAYLNPDGTVQHHHYRLPTFPALVASVSGLRRLRPFRGAVRRYRMLDEDFSRPRPIEQPSASCLLLRRNQLPDPLLDEDFPIYFNDVMLAHHLASQRSQLWMTPDALVVHQLGASTRLLGASLPRHHLASLLRYAGQTQRRHLTFALKLLILAETSLRHVLGKSRVMPWPDLIAALRGDPGPLPKLSSHHA
jgi:GT2 family glycosyltransferase